MLGCNLSLAVCGHEEPGSCVGTLGLVPGLLLVVEEGEVGVVEQLELVGKFLDSLVSQRAVMEERW